MQEMRRFKWRKKVSFVLGTLFYQVSGNNYALRTIFWAHLHYPLSIARDGENQIYEKTFLAFLARKEFYHQTLMGRPGIGYWICYVISIFFTVDAQHFYLVIISVCSRCQSRVEALLSWRNKANNSRAVTYIACSSYLTMWLVLCVVHDNCCSES